MAPLGSRAGETDMCGRTHESRMAPSDLRSISAHGSEVCSSSARAVSPLYIPAWSLSNRNRYVPMPLRHGETLLSEVRVDADAYDANLRDDGTFVGDRANKRAFQPRKVVFQEW